ncbi:uncharacterized protein LY89DRAFT_664012 [Mollisia scopiformis]|uniref:Zn(2)-C6 fungal-type domain-containing protein n=1 Tax=Mollisia scopiformis TaxID=149040 RepID=A0A194XTS0_MOLSC|nr:uncharacterized protein LY89DRAFT_664012 [Mollisia scopiformis]KUJ23608.1 hypothetical protein LY89DRAFT_664012 [Mollisia scopiformis]
MDVGGVEREESKFKLKLWPKSEKMACNETRPICGNCGRHGVPCVYNNSPSTSARQPSPNERSFPPPKSKDLDLLADYRPTLFIPPPNDPNVQYLLSSMDSDDEKWEIPEGKPRRRLELRLQQNFIERTSQTLSGCQNAPVREVWAVEVPKLAFSNDNVLYGMLALSALHLLKSEPENQELRLARQAYKGLALREHRRAIPGLSSDTADAVCYASTLVMTDAFARLQDRPLDPWTPPMEWIQMARGSGSVFGAAFDQINNIRTAKIMPVVDAEPQLTDATVLFAESNRRGLEHLLRQDLSNERWDHDTQYAYQRALNYIGGVEKAVERGEHPLGTCRRMMAFALLGPKQFYLFVEEYRPRALVILAHYFAIYSKMEDLWWIGNVARREIQGIQRVLPAEWQGLMRAPLASVGLLAP